FFLDRSVYHPDLHSFPTRRSSDLGGRTLEVIYSRRQGGETQWIVRLPDGSSAIRKSDLLVSILLFIISKSDFLRCCRTGVVFWRDRKSTRLNSSHDQISYAVFCLK